MSSYNQGLLYALLQSINDQIKENSAERQYSDRHCATYQNVLHFTTYAKEVS